MFCPNCKKSVPESFRICPYCSSDLNSYQNRSLKNIQENIAYLKTLKQYFETALTNIENELKNISFTKPETLQVEQTPSQITTTQKIQAKPQKEPIVKGDFFEKFFGEKLLLTVGILAVLFAAGFFLKYSFEKNLFSPLVKVALTSAFGVVFILLGSFLKEKQKTFGLVLTAGGIAVLFFANFAATALYYLYGLLVSLFINLLLIAFSVYLAVNNQSQWIAVIGIGGGFLTPLFLKTQTLYPAAYFTYLAILSGGSFIITLKKKWSFILFTAFVFSSIWFTDWNFSFYNPEAKYLYLILGLFFYFIFVLSPIAFEKPDRALKLIPASFSIAIFPVASTYCGVPVTFNLLYIAVAVITVTAAKKKLLTKSEEINSFIFAAGILSLFAGIYIGETLVASTAFSAMFVLFLALAYFYSRKSFFALLSIFTAMFVFFKTFIYDLSNNLGYNFDRMAFSANSALRDRIMEYFAVIVFLIVAAKVFKKTESRVASAITTFFGFLSGVLILTFETASFFKYHLPKAQNLSVSVLWTLIGFIMFTLGIKQKKPAAKIGGYIMFFIVFFKVFLIDISALSTIYKVITFLFVGIILIVSSYIYYKTKKETQ